MKEINLPPFYVGQRVVALRSHSQNKFKKGSVHIVKGCKNSCCGWLVNIGVSSMRYKWECSDCGKTNPSDGVWWMAAYCFAPIEPTFQSITMRETIEIESPLISVN